MMLLIRSWYPLHRENRENGGEKSVRENTGNLAIFAKTQEKDRILFAQVVNSLILKVKDISIFAAKISSFFFGSWKGLPSQFCVCNSHKSHKLAQRIFFV